jgi:D-3-phosphoglycerate dehydrogenase
MSKVLITDYIENPNIEKGILQEKLTDDVKDNVAVLLVWHKIVDEDYIESFPGLKGIVRYGIGYDNIDVDYATSKGIYVCNTPDYGVDEVSDTAITMIMNIVRGVTRYDALSKALTDGSWEQNTLQSLKRTSESMLGVIGAGRIGGAVILKAGALRLKACFYDPYKDRGYEKVLGAKRVESREELLEISDIVSIHTPLTEETRGMVDREFITTMKEGASFVNTARGKIIKNIDIFYEPLKSGHLSNVVFDVLPNEPPKESKLLTAWRNREKWLEGRLIITPHTAFYSREAFMEMRTKAAFEAKRIIEGGKLLNCVNEGELQRG